MPELEIIIGGRSFEVACQEGEEHFLQTAAGMLDAEAQVLIDQIGRVPEARMDRATRSAQLDRSFSVYPTTVGLPVVPEEPWIRRSCACGTANRPNG